jgi:hypothetical protein
MASIPQPHRTRSARCAEAPVVRSSVLRSNGIGRRPPRQSTVTPAAASRRPGAYAVFAVRSPRHRPREACAAGTHGFGLEVTHGRSASTTASGDAAAAGKQDTRSATSTISPRNA